MWTQPGRYLHQLWIWLLCVCGSQYALIFFQLPSLCGALLQVLLAPFDWIDLEGEDHKYFWSIIRHSDRFFKVNTNHNVVKMDCYFESLHIRILLTQKFTCFDLKHPGPLSGPTMLVLCCLCRAFQFPVFGNIRKFLTKFRTRVVTIHWGPVLPCPKNCFTLTFLLKIPVFHAQNIMKSEKTILFRRGVQPVLSCFPSGSASPTSWCCAGAAWRRLRPLRCWRGAPAPLRRRCWAPSQPCPRHRWRLTVAVWIYICKLECVFFYVTNNLKEFLWYMIYNILVRELV